MSILITVIAIAIGLPLILVAIGFLILVTKSFSGQNNQANRAQTLEVARQLECALTSMESRLGALEDIILTTPPRKGGTP